MDIDPELLDLCFDLPDDLAVLPVDEFFDDYIAALGSDIAQPSSSKGSTNFVRVTGSSNDSGGAVSSGAQGSEVATAERHDSPQTRFLGGQKSSPSTESRLPSPPVHGYADYSFQNVGGPAFHTQGLQHTGQGLRSKVVDQGDGSGNQHPSTSASLPPIVELTRAKETGREPHHLSPTPSLDIPLPELHGLLPTSEVLGQAEAGKWMDCVNLQRCQPGQYHQFEAPAGNSGPSSSVEQQVVSGCDLPNRLPKLAVPLSADVEAGRIGGTSSERMMHPGTNDRVPAQHSQLDPQQGLLQGNSMPTPPALPQCNQLDDSGMSDGEAGEGDMLPELDGKPRRRRNRTERQQMLNKQAQRRYRERKKQRALDTERAAEALATKMEEYNIVQLKHRQLSEQKQALLLRLAEADAQLEAAHSNASKQECDGLQLEEVDTLATMLHGKVFQLREYLRQCGLESSTTTLGNSQPAPGAQQAIAGLVEEILKLAICAHRSQGVDVWSMLRSAPPVNGCPVSCTCSLCRRKETWAEIALVLQLTPDQCRKIAHIRQEYARKINNIFQERQQLNMEAVSVMLPQGDGGSVPQMLSGQVANYAFLDFFQRARHSAKVSDVIKALKTNLSLEQRAASEVDYITFHRILTPIQGAWFILEAYPLRCNSLALGDAVLQLSGYVDASSTNWAIPQAPSSGGLPNAHADFCTGDDEGLAQMLPPIGSDWGTGTSLAAARDAGGEQWIVH